MASTITAVARDFFAACETGKGWEGCRQYCKPDATFSAQAEPLADVRTLQQYTDWMKGMLTPLPDGRYELKSFASDRSARTSARTAFSSRPTRVQAVRVPRPARA